MKTNLIILPFIFLGLWACNNANVNNPSEQNTETDAYEKLYVQNPALYDESFINDLAKQSNPIQLLDNKIVVDKDTFLFPEDLPLNTQIAFKAQNEKYRYNLVVTRKNMTTLAYVFQLFDKISNEVIEDKSGNAILNSTFYLGTENDVDTKTQEDYGAYEYWDYSNDCNFSIRVGIGKDEKNKVRAKVTYECLGKSIIPLDECPTLRSE